MRPGDLGTVLGVWAHPDDEAYLMSGTALQAREAGSRVACITATAGEAGISADESRWPAAELGTIRRNELAATLRVLGIDDHTWLNLPDNQLADIDPEAGVRLVAEVIERIQPDTILTFGPEGMTGHLDHVTIGNWAVEAAALVARTGCRVLSSTKTPAWLEEFASVNDGILAPDPPCTDPGDLVLEVALNDVELDLKLEALRAQASQTSGLIAALGETTYRAWLAQEFWAPRTVR